jgi:hypothetical protein
MHVKRDAGSVNSKELRVNKRDSPRISKEIHIDRKQPLGVSLKGSSEQVLATCGLDENPEWAQARGPRQKTKGFVLNGPKIGPVSGAIWESQIKQVSRSSRLMVWGT